MTQRTITLVVPDGYASGEEFAKDCGFEIAKPKTLDYPTAWAIQRKGGLEHHPRCSCVPGWDPISGPSFLCDCGAVIKEWERLNEGTSSDLANHQKGD